MPRWKRALDLICLVLTAPAWLPLMAVIAIIVKLTSPGPILFRQERVGHHGRRFTCFKFRTMRHAAETDSHQRHLDDLIRSDAPMKKLDGADSRVVPFARILRASGLDELPQLFNVWRGEMSLVGPRPCIPYEYERYSARQQLRFNAVPGLTGLWQVSGKNNTTFQQMIELDIRYAASLSLRQDISILFRTFAVITQQTMEVRQTRPMTSSKVSVRPVASIPRRSREPRTATTV